MHQKDSLMSSKYKGWQRPDARLAIREVHKLNKKLREDISLQLRIALENRVVKLKHQYNL